MEIITTKERGEEMKIMRDTGSYNERRYGKPWIAKIGLDGNELKFNFGTWIGSPGCEGVLVLESIEPGEYYARGQKDFRKPRNSAPDFYVLTFDGEGAIKSKVEVYKELAAKADEQKT
jgi:hypothetical protein